MALVRSPLHRLAGRHTAVLSYTAPTSGRSIQLPVQAVRSGDRWLVAVGLAERKTWWTAFRHWHAASLRSGRVTTSVIGRQVKGPAREAALTTYLQTRGYGGTLDPDTPVVEFRKPSRGT